MVELRTHGYRGETAAALALEVCRRRRRDAEQTASRPQQWRRRHLCGRLGRGAAKDGAEARRNGAAARASLRRQVAGGLERSEHGIAVDGVGGLGSQRFESAVS
jgi:hypothetical protein